MSLMLKIVSNGTLVFYIFVQLYRQCDAMQDPHDMFQVFNSHKVELQSAHQQQEQSEKSLPKALNSRGIFVETPLKSMKPKLSEKTEPCTEFLWSLVENVIPQISTQFDVTNVDVCVKMSLTSKEVQVIKQYMGADELQKSQLCLILKDSIVRCSSLATVPYPLLLLQNVWSYLIDSLPDMTFYWRSFKFTIKEFILFVWGMMFVSCLLFLFVLRKSLVFTAVWILICVLFLSTCTVYLRKYQEAVVERETMLMAQQVVGLPPECLKFEKGWIHKLTELMTGPYPASMSEKCKEFYRKMSINPELDIKLIDALAETFLSLFEQVVKSAFDTATIISDKAYLKYGMMFSWLIFGLTLVFIFFIIVLLLNGEISTMLFTVRTRSMNGQRLPHHRQFVETVAVATPQLPPVASVPLLNDVGVSMSAELIHQLLEKQAQSIESRMKKNSHQEILQSQNFVRPTMETVHSEMRHRKSAYNRLHSAVNLSPSPTKVLGLRRSSF